MSTPTPCDVRLGATEAGEVLLLLDDEESLRMTWKEALSLGLDLLASSAAACGVDRATFLAAMREATAAADVLGACAP